MNFQTTHIIVTQADKDRINGVCHVYKLGTEVMWLGNTRTHIKVINENGSLQFVELKDLKVIAK